jgi:hypothetical protein
LKFLIWKNVQPHLKQLRKLDLGRIDLLELLAIPNSCFFSIREYFWS